MSAFRLKTVTGLSVVTLAAATLFSSALPAAPRPDPVLSELAEIRADIAELKAEVTYEYVQYTSPMVTPSGYGYTGVFVAALGLSGEETITIQVKPMLRNDGPPMSFAFNDECGPDADGHGYVTLSATNQTFICQVEEAAFYIYQIIVPASAREKVWMAVFNEGVNYWPGDFKVDPVH